MIIVLIYAGLAAMNAWFAIDAALNGDIMCVIYWGFAVLWIVQTHKFWHAWRNLKRVVE